MSAQTDKAQRLQTLHHDVTPLVLFNIWDPGSARAVADAGAQALATSSWSVAAANGYPDGEALSLEIVLDNVARIAAACDLPISVDLERGYEDIEDTIRRAIAAGAVGCNIEDGLVSGLRCVDEQAQRLADARKAATAAGVEIFINARTDIFLQTPPEQHDAGLIELALDRGRRYAAAGANGLFVPGLVDEALIADLVRESALPVNVMVVPGAPSLARLAALGVSRVSHGPGPYLQAMHALAQASLAARALE